MTVLTKAAVLTAPTGTTVHLRSATPVANGVTAGTVTCWSLLTMSADYQTVLELRCRFVDDVLVEQGVVDRATGEITRFVPDATRTGSRLSAHFADVDLRGRLGEDYIATGYLEDGGSRSAVDGMLGD